MRLVNLPAMRRRSLETLSHTSASVLHALLDRPDVAVLFNTGNAPLIPILKAGRIPIAIHTDGLEWQRAKWSGLGARYYRWAESVAVRSQCALISDAEGIAAYFRETHKRESTVIAYGADILHPACDKLSEFRIEPREYHLVVARMEPENHIDVIVEGHRLSGTQRPLLVVGSTPYPAAYERRVHELGRFSDVRFLGAVWDQELLNQLYANAASYLHGHSVGGTNPSLLRALGCGAPVTAFDVNFNREVTAGNARFFSDAAGVARCLRADEADTEGTAARGLAGRQHAAEAFRWDDVADKYEQLLASIATKSHNGS
jgi:glycosyltransferase involved in cell wall biosynthesis